MGFLGPHWTQYGVVLLQSGQDYLVRITKTRLVNVRTRKVLYLADFQSPSVPLSIIFACTCAAVCAGGIKILDMAIMNEMDAFPSGTLAYEMRRDELQRGVQSHEGLIKPDSVYCRLNSGQIRLFVLDPECDGLGTVTGKLVTAELYSLKRSYEALSYTWGSSEHTHSILCNGKEFGVSTNLYEALRDLREADKARVLWIDALCIDQDDLLERSQQVQLMGDVFYSADKVMVYLGKETNDVKGAFQLIKRIHQPISPRTWLLESTWHHRQYWAREGLNISSRKRNRILHQTKAHDWNVLDRLLRRPWFTRVWVIQEVGHARKVDVICGRSVMDWDVFADVVRDLKYGGITAKVLSSQAESASYNVLEMQRARMKYSWNRRNFQKYQPKRLSHLLLSTSSAQCSDPRDKIYGMLGLAGDINKEELTGFWAPDYSERNTSVDVFKRFAVWNLRRNTSLECLSYATEQNPQDEEHLSLPSWAPDWTSRLENEHPFIRYNEHIPFRSHDGVLQDIFWLGRPGSPYEKLSIMAKPVDTVRELSGPSTFKCLPLELNSHQDLFEAASDSRKWLVQCLEFFTRTVSNNSYNSPISSNTEYWKLMTCGLTGEGFASPRTFSTDFKHYIDFLNHIVRKGSEEKEPSDNTFRMLARHGDSIARIESSLYMWASRRRLACTEKSRLCWLPSFSRQGDIVCVIPGCKVPYIFRPLGNNDYTIIGEAYVQGIMFGEENIKPKGELTELRIV